MKAISRDTKNAIRELVLRNLARKDFLAFAQIVLPWWQPYCFHRKLAEVITSDDNRIMIFSPPQHGKSTVISVLYPAWLLGKNPKLRIIIVSYSAALAEVFSFRIREIINSLRYKSLFPNTIIKKDRSAISYWETTENGYLLATGVEGAMTGYSADIGIIDDPIENWAKASSQSFREHLWLWYSTTFLSRLQEESKVILVMTRWHEDDLASRIIKSSGNSWKVYRFPAIAEDSEEKKENDKIIGVITYDLTNRTAGQPLVPELHSLQKLQELRNYRGFSALYQGVPRPAEGFLFRRDWVKTAEMPLPKFISVCRYWDKSSGVHSSTAGVLAGITKSGEIYILDVVSGMWKAAEREKVIENIARKDNDEYENYRVVIEQEPGSGGKDSADFTRNNLLRFGISVFVDKPQTNKDARFDLVSSIAQSGRFYVCRFAWYDNFVDNLCALPVSSNRDVVDATSGSVKFLLQSTSISVENLFYYA